MKITALILTLVLFLSSGISAQSAQDRLKHQAKAHMQYARYGEAIDLLNKYISAYPQKADGLNLRGLCYEARTEYEYAVLDLRRALKLEPNNKEIQTNLSRVEKKWYPLLEKKIAGHKREIAINPNIAVNYLEIGKCKKNLGLWKEAEEWYDEYLKREDASSDEVIRYSQILAHNNQIVKGEKILKKYVERFPKDQRLWSRYGFFTMWLGKNKIAVDAFENALALKPYFIEAQEGLYQAKGKLYIFEWTDTVERYKAQKAPPEYIIDKYYRIVRRNSGDSETRFLLIEELFKAERLEEAYQNLQILAEDHMNDERFRTLWDTVTTYREITYKKKVEQYTERLKKTPSDKDASIRLANYYSNLRNYDSAVVILRNYLATKPKGDDSNVRFSIAKNLAWNFQSEEAIEELNILLSRQPENLDYQVLRALIAVWTVQDHDLALKYLSNIESKDPENVQMLLGFVSILVRDRDFVTAKAYLDKAKELDPKGRETENMQNYYDLNLSLEEDRKNFEILVEARNAAVDGDCLTAIQKYDEYFTKVPSPTKMVLLEYADVHSCAKDLNRAIEIYEQILTDEYDYDVSLLRAKTLLWNRDSLKALEEFKRLTIEDTSNFEVKLYLGDSYVLVGEYGDAEDMYEELLEATSDTATIAMLNQRISWIPADRGFSGLFSTFPNHVGISPIVSYYSDNYDLVYRNFGGRLELGVNGFMAIGASFYRGNLTGKYKIKSYTTSAVENFTSFKGHIYLFPIKDLIISAGFGRLTYRGTKTRNISDFSIKYQKPDKFMLYGLFEETDAGLILFSTRLIDYRVNSQLYKLFGDWSPSLKTKLSGSFQYVLLGDANKGNDLLLKFGRLLDKDIWGGYEYFYSNYAFISKFYYSPRTFESHALWAEWEVMKEEDVTAKLGGKIGYVPMSDFILRELTGEFLYKPINNLTINGKFTLGGTYRYDSNYQFFSSSVSLYWSF